MTDKKNSSDETRETPVAPVPFAAVLKEELQELQQRREKVFSAPPTPPPAGSEVDWAHAFGALGVGLSGGGIRSATFNLGILQGLAKRNLLPYIDYLSTVSGGGYIGTWLHGVILRKYNGDPVQACPPAKGAPDTSLNRPFPGRAEDDPVTFLRKYSNYLAPRWNLLSADAWVIGCIWLRNMFLNQLILVPFLAAVVALTLIVRNAFRLVPTDADLSRGGAWLTAGFGFALLLMAVAWAVGSLRRTSGRSTGSTADWPSSWPTIIGVLGFGWCLFPVLGRVLRVQIGQYRIGHGLILMWLGFSVLFFLHQYFGGFTDNFVARRKLPPVNSLRDLWTEKTLTRLLIHLLWMPSVAGLATTALLQLAANLIGTLSTASSMPQVVWGPPLLVGVVCMGASLHVGLMGADFPDESREWLARIAAVGSLICFGWMAIVGLSVYGPYLVTKFAWNHGPAAVGIVVAWGGSILAGLLAAGSSKTKGGAGGVADFLLKIVPAILMIGILLAIATACHALLIQGVPGPEPVAKSGDSTLIAVTVIKPAGQATTVNVDASQSYAGWFAWAHDFEERDFAVLHQSYNGPLRLMAPSEWAHVTEGQALLIFLICGALAGLLPLRFNINEFSMHHFYKNRLVRCYLGAGNAHRRKPNPFTGFDPGDEIDLERLRPGYQDPKKPSAPRYLGPYPIVNTTLNLNAGSELATQERKANSFVFTPRYCGFKPLYDGKTEKRYAAEGYVRTETFYSAAGPWIGTAMAISGAAANPNWGYHTSAPVAFLLTMFNVRLGWWVGNTRVVPTESSVEPKLPWQRPGPRYSLFWLLWELLGQTTDHSAYVNLSDGGHFENLGLYELVRRRCRYIIIGDGEEDGGYTFESLGGAIRKCRADFGVEIDIDIEQIRSAEASKRTHCVVGTIRYPDPSPDRKKEIIARASLDDEPVLAPDDCPHGWILYLKASLTGDEPEDVKQYKDSHPAFPQESTMNQFFTESQFESYRRLGLHVVESVLADIDKTLIPLPGKDAKGHVIPVLEKQRRDALDTLFQRLAALWYGEPVLPAGAATKLNEQYSDLMIRLSKDKDLGFLDGPFLLTGVRGQPIPGGLATEVERKADFFTVDMIQLMENVWFDLSLDKETNRNHPKFQGWMRTFKRWAHEPYFLKVWKQVEKNYNPLFQDFVGKL